MNGITLRSPRAGEYYLPHPAHNQQIDTEGNQTVSYSASGLMRTFIHGPQRYRIARTFESLDEGEMSLFATWWKNHGRSGPAILYCWLDFDDKHVRGMPCRLAEPPKTTRVMKNMYDLTLVFEHDRFPDRHTASSPVVSGFNSNAPINPFLGGLLSGGFAF